MIFMGSRKQEWTVFVNDCPTIKWDGNRRQWCVSRCVDKLQFLSLWCESGWVEEAQWRAQRQLLLPQWVRTLIKEMADKSLLQPLLQNSLYFQQSAHWYCILCDSPWTFDDFPPLLHSWPWALCCDISPLLDYWLQAWAGEFLLCSTVCNLSFYLVTLVLRLS